MHDVQINPRRKASWPRKLRLRSEDGEKRDRYEPVPVTHADEGSGSCGRCREMPGSLCRVQARPGEVGGGRLAGERGEAHSRQKARRMQDVRLLLPQGGTDATLLSAL